MTDHSTHPMQVKDGNPVMWQYSGIEWPFGPTRGALLPLEGEPKRVDESIATANSDDIKTVGTQRIMPADSPAVVIESRKYGRRGLQALGDWEGVVERVAGAKFHCRLAPLRFGVSDRSQIELTEFSLDDLDFDSDRGLVVPGAVLYWTVGRARNAAGTVSNTSLVRLRRLPALSSAQKVAAELEAEEMFQAFNEE